MTTLEEKGPSAPVRSASSERRVFTRLLIAIGLGILLGLFLGEAVAPMRIVADGFVRLLQVTVLPYLLGSILSGLGRRTPAESGSFATRSRTRSSMPQAS